MRLVLKGGGRTPIYEQAKMDDPDNEERETVYPVCIPSMHIDVHITLDKYYPKDQFYTEYHVSSNTSTSKPTTAMILAHHCFEDYLKGSLPANHVVPL